MAALKEASSSVCGKDASSDVSSSTDEKSRDARRSRSMTDCLPPIPGSGDAYDAKKEHDQVMTSQNHTPPRGPATPDRPGLFETIIMYKKDMDSDSSTTSSSKRSTRKSTVGSPLGIAPLNSKGGQETVSKIKNVVTVQNTKSPLTKPPSQYQQKEIETVTDSCNTGGDVPSKCKYERPEKVSQSDQLVVRIRRMKDDEILKHTSPVPSPSASPTLGLRNESQDPEHQDSTNDSLNCSQTDIMCTNNNICPSLLEAKSEPEGKPDTDLPPSVDCQPTTVIDLADLNPALRRGRVQRRGSRERVTKGRSAVIKATVIRNADKSVVTTDDSNASSALPGAGLDDSEKLAQISKPASQILKPDPHPLESVPPPQLEKELKDSSKTCKSKVSVAVMDTVPPSRSAKSPLRSSVTDVTSFSDTAPTEKKDSKISSVSDESSHDGQTSTEAISTEKEIMSTVKSSPIGGCSRSGRQIKVSPLALQAGLFDSSGLSFNRRGKGAASPRGGERSPKGRGKKPLEAGFGSSPPHSAMSSDKEDHSPGKPSSAAKSGSKKSSKSEKMKSARFDERIQSASITDGQLTSMSESCDSQDGIVSDCDKTGNHHRNLAEQALLITIPKSDPCDKESAVKDVTEKQTVEMDECQSVEVDGRKNVPSESMCATEDTIESVGTGKIGEETKMDTSQDCTDRLVGSLTPCYEDISSDEHENTNVPFMLTSKDSSYKEGTSVTSILSSSDEDSFHGFPESEVVQTPKLGIIDSSNEDKFDPDHLGSEVVHEDEAVTDSRSFSPQLDLPAEAESEMNQAAPLPCFRIVDNPALSGLIEKISGRISQKTVGELEELQDVDEEEEDDDISAPASPKDSEQKSDSESGESESSDSSSDDEEDGDDNDDEEEEEEEVEEEDEASEEGNNSELHEKSKLDTESSSESKMECDIQNSSSSLPSQNKPQYSETDSAKQKITDNDSKEAGKSDDAHCEEVSTASITHDNEESMDVAEVQDPEEVEYGAKASGSGDAVLSDGEITFFDDEEEVMNPLATLNLSYKPLDKTRLLEDLKKKSRSASSRSYSTAAAATHLLTAERQWRTVEQLQNMNEPCDIDNKFISDNEKQSHDPKPEKQDALNDNEQSQSGSDESHRTETVLCPMTGNFVNKVIERPAKSGNAFVSNELEEYLKTNTRVSQSYRRDPLLYRQPSLPDKFMSSSEATHQLEMKPDRDEIENITFFSFISRDALMKHISCEIPTTPEEMGLPSPTGSLDTSGGLDENQVNSFASQHLFEKTTDITKIKGWKKKFVDAGVHELETRTESSDAAAGCSSRPSKIHWRTQDRLVKSLSSEQIEMLGLFLKKKRRKIPVFTKRKGSTVRTKGKPLIKPEGEEHVKYSSSEDPLQRAKQHSLTSGGKKAGRPFCLINNKVVRERLCTTGRPTWHKARPATFIPEVISRTMAISACRALQVPDPPPRVPKTEPCDAPGCRYGCVCHLCDPVEADDNEDSRMEVVEPAPEIKCDKEYCRLGCICESIDSKKKETSKAPPRREREHCGKAECMFGCKCEVLGSVMISPQKDEEAADMSSIIADEMEQLHSKEAESYEEYGDESRGPGRPRGRGRGGKTRGRGGAKDGAFILRGSNVKNDQTAPVRKSSRLKDHVGFGAIDKLNSLVFFDTSAWLSDTNKKKKMQKSSLDAIRDLEREKHISIRKDENADGLLVPEIVLKDGASDDDMVITGVSSTKLGKTQDAVMKKLKPKAERHLLYRESDYSKFHGTDYAKAAKLERRLEAKKQSRGTVLKGRDEDMEPGEIIVENDEEDDEEMGHADAAEERSDEDDDEPLLTCARAGIYIPLLRRSDSKKSHPSRSGFVAGLGTERLQRQDKNLVSDACSAAKSSMLGDGIGQGCSASPLQSSTLKLIGQINPVMDDVKVKEDVTERDPPSTKKKKKKRNAEDMENGASAKKKELSGDLNSEPSPKVEVKFNLPGFRTQMVLLQRKAVKTKYNADDDEREIPHLLEIQTNCNWDAIRSSFLSKVSGMIETVDYPPVVTFAMKGFNVAILPKPDKPTSLPPNLQMALKRKEMMAIRVMISDLETDLATLLMMKTESDSDCGVSPNAKPRMSDPGTSEPGADGAASAESSPPAKCPKSLSSPVAKNLTKSSGGATQSGNVNNFSWRSLPDQKMSTEDGTNESKSGGLCTKAGLKLSLGHNIGQLSQIVAGASDPAAIKSPLAKTLLPPTFQNSETQQVHPGSSNAKQITVSALQPISTTSTQSLNALDSNSVTLSNGSLAICRNCTLDVKDCKCTAKCISPGSVTGAIKIPLMALQAGAVLPITGTSLVNLTQTKSASGQGSSTVTFNLKNPGLLKNTTSGVAVASAVSTTISTMASESVACSASVGHSQGVQQPPKSQNSQVTKAAPFVKGQKFNLGQIASFSGAEKQIGATLGTGLPLRVAPPGTVLPGPVVGHIISNTGIRLPVHIQAIPKPNAKPGDASASSTTTVSSNGKIGPALQKSNITSLSTMTTLATAGGNATALPTSTNAINSTSISSVSLASPVTFKPLVSTTQLFATGKIVSIPRSGVESSQVRPTLPSTEGILSAGGDVSTVVTHSLPTTVLASPKISENEEVPSVDAEAVNASSVETGDQCPKQASPEKLADGTQQEVNGLADRPIENQEEAGKGESTDKILELQKLLEGDIPKIQNSSALSAAGHRDLPAVSSEDPSGSSAKWKSTFKECSESGALQSARLAFSTTLSTMLANGASVSINKQQAANSRPRSRASSTHDESSRASFDRSRCTSDDDTGIHGDISANASFNNSPLGRGHSDSPAFYDSSSVDMNLQSGDPSRDGPLQDASDEEIDVEDFDVDVLEVAEENDGRLTAATQLKRSMNLPDQLKIALPTLKQRRKQQHRERRLHSQSVEFREGSGDDGYANSSENNSRLQSDEEDWDQLADDSATSMKGSRNISAEDRAKITALARETCVMNAVRCFGQSYGITKQQITGWVKAANGLDQLKQGGAKDDSKLAGRTLELDLVKWLHDCQRKRIKVTPDMIIREVSQHFHRLGIRFSRDAADAWFRTWKRRYNITDDLQFRPVPKFSVAKVETIPEKHKKEVLVVDHSRQEMISYTDDYTPSRDDVGRELHSSREALTSAIHRNVERVRRVELKERFRELCSVVLPDVVQDKFSKQYILETARVQIQKLEAQENLLILQKRELVDHAEKLVMKIKEIRAELRRRKYPEVTTIESAGKQSAESTSTSSSASARGKPRGVATRGGSRGPSRGGRGGARTRGGLAQHVSGRPVSAKPKNVTPKSAASSAFSSVEDAILSGITPDRASAVSPSTVSPATAMPASKLLAIQKLGSRSSSPSCEIVVETSEVDSIHISDGEVHEEVHLIESDSESMTHTADGHDDGEIGLKITSTVSLADLTEQGHEVEDHSSSHPTLSSEVEIQNIVSEQEKVVPGVTSSSPSIESVCEVSSSEMHIVDNINESSGLVEITGTSIDGVTYPTGHTDELLNTTEQLEMLATPELAASEGLAASDLPDTSDGIDSCPQTSLLSTDECPVNPVPHLESVTECRVQDTTGKVSDPMLSQGSGELSGLPISAPTLFDEVDSDILPYFSMDDLLDASQSSQPKESKRKLSCEVDEDDQDCPTPKKSKLEDVM